MHRRNAVHIQYISKMARTSKQNMIALGCSHFNLLLFELGKKLDEELSGTSVGK